jgi:hypothetical protein
MSRKLLFVSTLLCGLAMGVSVTQAALVGYWAFDENQGTVTKDLSGKGHDGTIAGTANWVGGAPGFRWALQFDGSTTAVTCGDWVPSLVNDPNNKKVSVALWVKFLAGGASQYQGIVAVRNSYADQSWSLECSRSAVTSTTASMQFGISGASAYGIGTLTAGVWTHLVLTMDASSGTAATYLITNGGAPSQKSGPNFGPSTVATVRIGHSDVGANLFCGVIDDVRLYDSILTQTDASSLMYPPAYTIASNPTPGSGATDVLATSTLSWTAGTGTVKQDVYFGTNAASLTKVATGQVASTYAPKMALGTTYYWRVDEVNTGGKTLTGDLWNFTTEPFSYVMTGTVTATASSVGAGSGAASTTTDKSGMTGDTAGTAVTSMWVTSNKDANVPWIKYQFDNLYKLDQMWVWNFNSEDEPDYGFGIKDAKIEYSTDGTAWTVLYDTLPLQDGTGLVGYACNNKVDMKKVAAKYVRISGLSNFGGLKSYGLSEVRFYWIPAFATAQVPANNTTGVRPDVVLNWRPGRSATQQKIYFGTNQTAVTNGNVVPFMTTDTFFVPGELPLDGTSYYWRVDEVNPKDTPSVWTGSVMRFATATYLVVDDMESYSGDTAHNKGIYQAWADGRNSSKNGSTVGNATAPFVETSVVHTGSGSMPFYFNNTTAKPTSEATLTFATPQNWLIGGIQTLTMWVRPDVNNVAGQKLYVKFDGVKMAPAFGGSLTVAGPVPTWQQWNIDLAYAQNVLIGGLDSVSTFTIGVEGLGKGLIYIDDIRLYKSAPAVAKATDPGTTGILAYYKMEGDVKDSSGKANDGTIVSAPTFVSGLAAFSKALKFNGTSDCVDLGNKDIWNFTGGSFSISLWANVGAWGSAWGHVMMGNRGEDSKGWQIRRGSSTGVCFTTRGVGGTDDLTGVAPALNQWVNIVCSYDNVLGVKNLYVNGELSATSNTTVGAKLTVTTHNTYIGCRANSGNTAGESFFTGMLDEVRVYTRALTAGEASYLAGNR